MAKIGTKPENAQFLRVLKGIFDSRGFQRKKSESLLSISMLLW